MNLRLLLASATLVLITAGCGSKEAAPAASAPASTDTTATSSTAAVATAAAPAKAAPRTIEITGGDNMKFNVTTIEAKPGEQLKVILTNIGTQPKEVMGHNWVLLKAGSDVAAFSAAAVVSKATDYIPAALKDQIIAHTALLGPRKSDEVVFTVPDAAGSYPFLCSFPAHFQVGMKGMLVVK